MSKAKEKRGKNGARPDAPPAGDVGGEAPGAPVNPPGDADTPAGRNGGIPSPDAPPASRALESFLPALDLPAPAADGAAAAAALEAPAPVATPDGGPGEPPAPASGPVYAAPVEGVEHWSRNRIRRSKRAELARRVEELQKTLETRPRRLAPGQAPAEEIPPAAAADELRDTLGYVLPGVSASLELFVGAPMRLEPGEQKVLAASWAPALASRYGELRGRVPLVPALLTTLGVLAPKLLETWRQAAERKHATGGAVHPGDAPPAPAPGQASGERRPLELVTDAPAAGPFGGPRE